MNIIGWRRDERVQGLLLLLLELRSPSTQTSAPIHPGTTEKEPRVPPPAAPTDVYMVTKQLGVEVMRGDGGDEEDRSRAEGFREDLRQMTGGLELRWRRTKWTHKVEREALISPFKSSSQSNMGSS